MTSYVAPTSPSAGTPTAASWADTVAADIALFASPAYFFAVYAVSSAITAGSNYPYGSVGTIVEDTLSGWNNTNNNYVIKSPGLYQVNFQIIATAPVAPLAQLVINGSLYTQGTFGSNSVGSSIALTKRFALNDTVAMRSSVNHTTNGATNLNFMNLTQLSWA